MNSTPIYWKRQNAAYIYADSEWGTAEGDGTQQKPFQTLEQVFEHLNANFYNTAAKVVVLRGYFPLTKTFMDYMCTSFVADKPYEAIVDGMNANGLLYCTNYDGLIIKLAAKLMLVANALSITILAPHIILITRPMCAYITMEPVSNLKLWNLRLVQNCRFLNTENARPISRQT